MFKEEKHEENALNVSSRKKKYSFIINLNMSISVSLYQKIYLFFLLLSLLGK